MCGDIDPSRKSPRRRGTMGARRHGEGHVYKAFISYNRADIEFARSLQRRLETYVVPKAVELTEFQGRSKRPLHPIFRDEDEMVGGGALTERLRDAIARSEYLIVVCSPAAATAGAWVDVEVREFLTRHGP